MSMEYTSIMLSFTTIVRVVLLLGVHIALIVIAATVVRKAGKAGKDASVWLMAAGAIGILTDLVAPIGQFLIQTVMGRSMGVDGVVTAITVFASSMTLLDFVGYALLLFGIAKFAKGVRQPDDAPKGNYLGS